MAKQTHENPLLHTIPRAADRYGISVKLMRDLIESGEIKTIGLGRRVLVPTSELETWIQRRLEQ